MTREKFIGAWDLIEFSCSTQHEKWYPLGTDLSGRIIYCENGQMSAQGIAIDKQIQASNYDWETRAAINPGDKEKMFNSYFGYFGTYNINEQEGYVEHIIEGHLIQSYMGKVVLKRNYLFKGELLILAYNIRDIFNQLVWEKTPEAQ